MQRTVLITGASRGIGAACALRFAKDGDRIAINYFKNKEKAEEIARLCLELGAESAEIFKADVSDSAEVQKMVDDVHSRFGKIDVLVNNAGIAQQKLLSDVSDADWERMIGVNLSGVFFCSRAVMADMINKKCGSIINVSSMWGQVGASCEVAYSAAKAGVIGFTKALAKELGPSGIRVNCVAPGVIDTDMNGALDEETIECLRDETPLMQIGSAQDVANTVYFLACDDAKFITGQNVAVNGGFII